MRHYERLSDKSGAWHLPLRVQDIINHGFEKLLQVFYSRHVTRSNGYIFQRLCGKKLGTTYFLSKFA